MMHRIGDTRRIAVVDNLIHSLCLVMAAAKKRAERQRLSEEARAKLMQMFGPMTEAQLEAKWRETEETAQIFREAFFSGEDGYQGKRIIDLVWQGVENNKVNRDREDNPNYTGGHIRALEKAGITFDQYETRLKELQEEFRQLQDKA